jgi:hypothetical protein
MTIRGVDDANIDIVMLNEGITGLFMEEGRYILVEFSLVADDVVRPGMSQRRRYLTIHFKKDHIIGNLKIKSSVNNVRRRASGEVSAVPGPEGERACPDWATSPGRSFVVVMIAPPNSVDPVYFL